jgi:hypothetical protein
MTLGRYGPSFYYILSISYVTDHTENAASNSSIVQSVFVAAGTYLQSRFLATVVSSGSTVPDYWGAQGHTDRTVISYAYFNFFQNKESTQKIQKYFSLETGEK